MRYSDKTEIQRRNDPTLGRASSQWREHVAKGKLFQSWYAQSPSLPIPTATRPGMQHGGDAASKPQTLHFKEQELHLMRQLRTFIVEDSPVIRESLIATLEELVPLQVVGTAEDESSAVQWLTRPNNQVDLVIVDIFLKGGSGLGVLRAAHNLSQKQTLVVLSNYATPDMRRKCLELGADRVFDKSNEIEALIQYCDALASGKTGSGTLS